MTITSFQLEGCSNAPVLVIGNSLGANYSMWDDQIEVWKKHFLVLRYDYRGHGDSPGLGAVASTEDLAKDIIELTDQLNIQKFHWLGLSLGAMLGLYMAAHYSDRVLSLSAACFRHSQTDETKAQWLTRIATVNEKGVQAIVDGTADRWLTESYRLANPADDQKLRKMIATTSNDGYMACGTAVMTYDSRPYAAKIQCPTLLISGEFDMGAPTAEVASLTKVIPNSQHVMLPTAHIANVECKREFESLVLNFVNNVAA
jgi:3-oxoadipate enol-lactonase